jgi:hypothetical protein
MEGKMAENDFNKPFTERYLATADALTVLQHWLMVVGMSGNKNFESLKSDFIRHGGETFNDIKRTAASNRPVVQGEQAND